MHPPPLVAVVIPTYRRPALLMRALESVFGQTHRNIEVIVVVDGPHEETMATLRFVNDPRLQVIVNPRSLSAAGARNVGAAHAKAEWIAFLDDDDEWLPNKLERQIAVANCEASLLVTCLSRIITPTATYVWPKTIYDNVVPLDEYLFDRRTTFSGDAFIQTSSYFLSRELFAASPFKLDTPHDDWEFILRLTKQFGARIETVPEVLVNLYFEERRPSLTSGGTWQASLRWLDQISPLLTQRGYSGICLGIVGPRAANQRAYSAFFPLICKAFRNGSPRLLQILAFFAFWVLPQDVRRRLRAMFGARSDSRTVPESS